MRDVMRDKARTTPEEAADKINDAVEDLTLKVLVLRLSATPSALQRRSTRKTNFLRFRKVRPFPSILTQHPPPVLLANVRATSSKSLQRPLLRRSRLKIEQEQQRKEDQR